MSNGIKRTLTYSLITLLVLQPAVAAAGVVVDSGAANQAGLTTANNGVQIVNIVAPSSKGVSHNKYTELDITSQGLIFNNAQSQANTSLAGSIAANPNLSAASASIILNEVTSANRSVLEGYAEIAGQSADFILANPNGITCNGCGFVNTPRATLTTGIPNLLNGGLSGFTVNGGEIAIDNLNASSIDRLDILARAITLNSELYANELNLVTGRNAINYSDLAATALVDGGSSKPAFALDVAALGGMYTNSIKLIGTEAGVGVNVSGEMATNTGNISLRADGTISVNKLVSSSDLIITSDSENLVLRGSAYAADSANLSASESVDLNGLLSAKANIQLLAKDITNTDTAVAGADFIANAETIINRGVLGAGNDARLSAVQRIVNGDVDNRSLIFSAENMYLHSNEVINRYADIVSLGDFFVAANDAGDQASYFYNGTGVIESFGNITINADEVVNRRDPIGGLYISHDQVINNDDFCQNSRHNYYCSWPVRGGESYGVLPNLVTEREIWLLEEYMAIEALDFSGDPEKQAQYPQELEVLRELFKLGLQPSEIYAGGNISINSKLLSNEGGKISAAKNLSINTDWLHNITRISIDSRLSGELSPYLPEGDDDDDNLEGQERADLLANLDPELVNLIELYKSYPQGGSLEGNSYLFYPALLEAGASLTINAAEGINNGVPSQGQPNLRLAPSLPEIIGDTISAASPQNISLKFSLSDDNPFDPFLDLPDLGDFKKVDVVIHQPNSSSLFTYANGNTLIATNASVAQFIDVQGSDYLLELLGVRPDETAKRLGDGFYESRLIRQAITAATGTRYLHTAFRSDAEQMQYLMQSAYRAQQSLNLSLGVSLSKNQVAALTHDMIWLEEQLVNGQSVLVPQLYLASVRPGHLDISGSSIVANDATLTSAGEINNFAGIGAANNLSINSEAKLDNRGWLISQANADIKVAALTNAGSIAAARDLAVTTQQDLLNQGGQISAQNIALNSEQGNIRNLQSQDSLANHIGEYVGQRGSVVAQGDLSLIAKQDVENKGSDITVGENLAMESGRDIKLTTNHYRYGPKNENVIHFGSDLSVGGNGSINAGRDLSLQGSELTVDGRADINVGRNLEFASVENRETTSSHEKIKYKASSRKESPLSRSATSGKYLHSDRPEPKDTTIITTTERVFQQEGELNVGGSLDVNVGNNVDIIASDINVAGAAAASVGGEFTLTAKDDVEYVTRTEIKAPVKKSRDGGSMFDLGLIVPTAEAIQRASEPKPQRLLVGLDKPRLDGGSVDVTRTEKVVGTKQATFASSDDLLVVSQKNITNTRDAELVSDQDVTLVSTEGSIINRGGSRIEGRNITLLAANDVINERSIEQIDIKTGSHHVITTDISEASQLKAGDDLLVQAARDVIDRGSAINAGGDTTIIAGRDIRFETAADRERVSVVRKRYENTKDITKHSVSNTAVGGELALLAERDATFESSQISADGDLRIRAEGDVQVLAAQNEDYSYYYKEKKSGGLAKKQEINIDMRLEKDAIAGVLSSGGELQVSSGGNQRYEGSQLVASGDITLQAGGDIDLASTQDVRHYYHFEEVKRSGFFGAGSIVGIGKQEEMQSYEQKDVYQKGSLAGSLQRDVDLSAGGAVNIKASEVFAANDITIDATDITLESDYDSHIQKTQREFLRSGINISAESPIYNDIKAVYDAYERSEEVEDPRLKALYQIRASRLASDVYEVAKSSSNSGNSATAFRVNIGLGRSHSQRESYAEEHTAVGSRVNAGGDVRFTASGEAGAADSGNIISVGGSINGTNVELDAANDITLRSAENARRYESSNKSSNGEVGLQFTVGDDTGFGIYVEGSQANGAVRSNDNQFLNSQIVATDKVNLQAAKDTSLVGAKITGENIALATGGDLSITSQQEDSNYESSQNSIDGGGSFGWKTKAVDANLAYSKSHIDADYRSVQQQTGLFAGKGGFDVQVGGNTDLQGGAILSEGGEDNSHLDTATLTYDQLENHSQYDASSTSASVSSSYSGGSGQSPVGMGGGFAFDSGSDSSTTYSAISDGADVVVRDEPATDLSGLKGSAEDAHRALGNTFDREEVERKVSEGRELVEVLVEDAPELAQQVQDLWGDVLDALEVELDCDNCIVTVGDDLDTQEAPENLFDAESSENQEEILQRTAELIIAFSEEANGEVSAENKEALEDSVKQYLEETDALLLVVSIFDSHLKDIGGQGPVSDQISQKISDGIQALYEVNPSAVTKAINAINRVSEAGAEIAYSVDDATGNITSEAWGSISDDNKARIAGVLAVAGGVVAKADKLGDNSGWVRAGDGADTNTKIPESTSHELTPVVISNMPKELSHQASSGVKLVANPDKTTTILGSYGSDTSKIIDELDYPKNLDFEAKQGGFNVLNTPDEFYKTPDQFWNQYNQPFLDKAIQRGDDIVLSTKPNAGTLNRKSASGGIERSGFGQEIDYLKSKGYRYEPSTNMMIKD